MENNGPKEPRKIKGDLCSINDRSYLIMSWCGFCQRQGHFEDECFKKSPSLLSSDPAESMKTSSTSRVCGETPPKSTARAILESLLLEAVSWETAGFSTSADREKSMSKSKPKDIVAKQNLAKVGNIENHRGKGSGLKSNTQAGSLLSDSCCQPRDLSALRRVKGSSSSYAKPSSQKRKKKTSARNASRKQANDAGSTHQGRGPKVPGANVSRKNDPAKSQRHKRDQPNLVCSSSTSSPPTKSLCSTLPFRTQPSSNIEEPEPWYLRDPVKYPFAPEKGSESERSSDSAPDLIDVSSPEAAPRPPQQILDSEGECGRSVAGTIANTSDKPTPKSMFEPKLKLDETPVLIPVQAHRDELKVGLGSRDGLELRLGLGLGLGVGLLPKDKDGDEDTDDDDSYVNTDEDDDTDDDTDEDDDSYDDTDEDDDTDEGKGKRKGKAKGKGKGKKREKEESESDSESSDESDSESDDDSDDDSECDVEGYLLD